MFLPNSKDEYPIDFLQYQKSNFTCKIEEEMRRYANDDTKKTKLSFTPLFVINENLSLFKEYKSLEIKLHLIKLHPIKLHSIKFHSIKLHSINLHPIKLHPIEFK